MSDLSEAIYIEGFKKGYAEGFAEGFSEGYSEVMKERTIKSARNLLRKTAMSDQQISDLLSDAITLEEIGKLRKEEKLS